jgi:hypothetical protein
MTGADLIMAVRRLGGAIHEAEPFYHWTLAQHAGTYAAIVAQHAPDLTRGTVAIHDFCGVAELIVDGQRFIALRTDIQVSPLVADRALVLGGPTLEALLELASRLKAVVHDLTTERLTPCGTGLTPNLRPVTEGDLILPEPFKQDLFLYLDRFWKSADICTRLGMSPSRGVMLVGAPGTGKTLAVRHLLGRYAFCRRYVYTNDTVSRNGRGDATFRSMLEMIAEGDEPALVVIEDIDRILETGAVTPELLLNALDGLFEPTVPVLWLATSNDPSGLADNLLDRPGRFDRVVEFPLPGVDERRRLLRRYSVWPIPSDVLVRLAQQYPSMSPVHYREACYAAAMAVVGEPGRYPEVLEEELLRVEQQHAAMQRRSFERLGRVPSGFGPHRIP